jgi:uncharacterized membrane protein YkvA (DUF1232 family)
MSASLVSTLQGMVDSFVADVEAVRDATRRVTQEAALHALYGALNYTLEQFDLYPDHMKGNGIVDDAIILRLGARNAAAAGADDPVVARLASEADVAREILGDVAPLLEEYVAKLPESTVRGRTVKQILANKDTGVFFWADVERELKRVTPQPVDLGGLDPVKELRRMLRAGLARQAKH